MPLSPEYTIGLSDKLLKLYRDAEQILLERIARALEKDLDAPDWAERKLLQMQLLQAQAVRQIATLTGQSAEEVAAAIVKAYNRGAAVAQSDVAKLVAAATQPIVPPGLPAVEGLVAESLANVQLANQRLLRFTNDVFRQVIASAAPQVLLGTQTRVEAAQVALNAFADRGVTGFIDRAGKNWAIDSYVEMSMRATTMNAAMQGHVERLLANGQDLVIVSNAPQECELCRPWEGKVLSLTGISRADGVRVAGTLDEARGDGLFHPSCRHSISIYIPGVTKAPTRTADPEGSWAREYLRSRERGVRKWKRREAVALTDAERQKARKWIEHYQAQIREHVDTTSAKRQRQREQIGRAR